ncbi:hypothetical protein MRB53_004713 [Persea americana]|uniref:Uncharacterized protein n=1 Tax=Persea americana TaxID=3435 RepID=A0ACC2MBY3_PERAE|nr:hypothetical protein MRB53_004713 [Persea americana]
MCRPKRNTNAIDPKKPITVTATNETSTSASTDPITESTRRDSSKNSYSYSSTSTSSTTLSSARRSLPQSPTIYSFSDISSATNNFSSTRISSNSWRCSLPSAPDAVVVHRKIRRRIQVPQLHRLFFQICKCHHVSLARLIGAAVSADNLYLVYDYAAGANLADCLRSPKNPNFTVLSTWISRMQVAADAAQALEYMHHYTGLDLHLVHNRIKSRSIIVTEPSFNAKVCYFGAALLAGEIPGLIEQIKPGTTPKMERSDSRAMRVERTVGYAPPENSTDAVVSQKSDVFAFGVVMLELISGEEPVQYRYDEKRRDRYERVSVVERAREAVERGRVRQWVDSRLKDSFPEEVAEKMTRVALSCVHVEADQRPDMRRVAGKISKLYLQSKAWSERIGVRTDWTASFAPR